MVQGSREHAEEWPREGKQNRGDPLSMGDGAGDPLSKGRRVTARKSGRVCVKPGGTAGAFGSCPCVLQRQGLFVLPLTSE